MFPFLSRELKADERKSVTALQPAAVTKRDGKDAVFLIDKDTARQVAVTVGAKIGDLVQVSGVKPGDKLVLSPTDKLKDGAPVTILKK